MKKDLQKFLANSALNISGDYIGKDNIINKKYKPIDNRRIIDTDVLTWHDYCKNILNNTLNISKKEIFIREIENTIMALEKETRRIASLNDTKQNWFCKIILGHINFLLQKYEIIKESTENEVEEEWSDYDLHKELKFILQQCIIKNK